MSDEPEGSIAPSDIDVINNLIARKEKLENCLRAVLAKCEAKYKNFSAELAVAALTNIPKGLLWPLMPLDSGVMQGTIDPDAKAMLLRIDQKRLGEVEMASWSDLSIAEKRSAKKLTNFLGSGRAFIKQRPAKIDYGLAIFLIFTFEGLLARRLPFSRIFQHGLGGPAFIALRIALDLAHCRARLRRPERELPARVGPEALAEIVRATRSKNFNEYLRSSGLGRHPEHVAATAHTLILELGLSRKRSRVKR